MNPNFVVRYLVVGIVSPPDHVAGAPPVQIPFHTKEAAMDARSDLQKVDPWHHYLVVQTGAH